MQIDLPLIARLLEREAAGIRANVKKCGCHWTPEQNAKYEADAAGALTCAATLRTPGLTNDDALAAITTMCRGQLERG